MEGNTTSGIRMIRTCQNRPWISWFNHSSNDGEDDDDDDDDDWDGVMLMNYVETDVVVVLAVQVAHRWRHVGHWCHCFLLLLMMLSLSLWLLLLLLMMMLLLLLWSWSSTSLLLSSWLWPLPWMMFLFLLCMSSCQLLWVVIFTVLVVPAAFTCWWFAFVFLLIFTIIWPNGIIFHQPRFPWNKGSSFPLLNHHLGVPSGPVFTDHRLGNLAPLRLGDRQECQGLADGGCQADH